MNELEIARREVSELSRMAPQSAMHRRAIERLAELRERALEGEQ